MSYCTETDLRPYLLQAYITAAESQTPGVVADHIARVTGEVDAYIGERYSLPLPSVPAILNSAAAVMVAYRVLGSVTSLINSEAVSENEFVYLQGEYKRAIKKLEDIRDGKIELFPASDGGELQDDTSISVSSSPKQFTDDMLGRF